jgi:hypothetical protein
MLFKIGRLILIKLYTFRYDDFNLLFFHTYGKTVVDFFILNRENLHWNISQGNISETMRNAHRIYI